MGDPRQRAALSAALSSPWFRSQSDALGTMPEDVANMLKERSEHSDLKMVLLNMVASKLQGDNLNHYQALWMSFDQDRSGTLNESEFVQMLMAQGMDKGI